MHDTVTDSVRSRRRVGRVWLSIVCCASLTAQIVIVAETPPHLRWLTAELLAMATLAAAITLGLEISFRRAAARAAEAAEDRPARSARPGRRGPADRISPLMQRAYYMARNDSPAPRIAGACDIPEAFAALIIDDVRRAASRTGRPARRLFGRRRAT